MRHKWCREDSDTAQSGDGSTQGSDILQIGVADCGLGRTDATACNYDADATLDDDLLILIALDARSYGLYQLRPHSHPR